MLQYLGLAHNRLGRAFTAGGEQLGHLFDHLQLLQVTLRLFITTHFTLLQTEILNRRRSQHISRI